MSLHVRDVVPPKSGLNSIAVWERSSSTTGYPLSGGLMHCVDCGGTIGASLYRTRGEYRLLRIEVGRFAHHVSHRAELGALAGVPDVTDGVASRCVLRSLVMGRFLWADTHRAIIWPCHCQNVESYPASCRLHGPAASDRRRRRALLLAMSSVRTLAGTSNRRGRVVAFVGRGCRLRSLLRQPARNAAGREGSGPGEEVSDDKRAIRCGAGGATSDPGQRGRRLRCGDCSALREGPRAASGR